MVMVKDTREPIDSLHIEHMHACINGRDFSKFSYHVTIRGEFFEDLKLCCDLQFSYSFNRFFVESLCLFNLNGETFDLSYDTLLFIQGWEKNFEIKEEFFLEPISACFGSTYALFLHACFWSATFDNHLSRVLFTYYGFESVRNPFFLFRYARKYFNHMF